jgi:hypothetical protein
MSSIKISTMLGFGAGVAAGNKAGDQTKYQHQLEQYHQGLLRYVGANRGSLDGLDADLGDQNPIRLWTRLQNEQQSRDESRTYKLAQTEYLAAKTSSDLDGHGVFTGVPPGACRG